MKRRLLGAVTACFLGVASLAAQETNQVEQLRKELEQLRQNFQRVYEQQRQQIEALQQQVERLQRLEQPRPATPPESTPSPSPATAPSDPGPSADVVPSPRLDSVPWSPSAPLSLFGQRDYLNLSLNGLLAAGTSTAEDVESLQLGGHDPRQRGFTLQNLEAVFEGKVDPYFRGQANVILQIDSEGETRVELEEAYLETMSLPANLQIRAGQFLTAFGRLNQTHPHTWDFVDVPLVNGRFLGEDGLRSVGTRLSWLTPTPFYSELMLTVANSQGETAFSFRNEHEDELFLGRPAGEFPVRNPGDLLFVPRYVASFDLTESQTILAGASAAFGPNSTGPNRDTQIYGVDLFWKWKSPRHHGGFPFVSWQTEAMLRRFEAGAFPGDEENPALPGETLVDYGLYSQVAYGFRKGWVAAVRGDYVFPDSKGDYERILGTDVDRARRWRLSPNLTWYPSEYSKLRLQYNLDQRHKIGQDHSVWLQLEFLLGSHAAHQF